MFFSFYRLMNTDFIHNISIVYTWVDGSDKEYRNLRDSYSYNDVKKGLSSRDRNNNELKYSLRSIKKYMPWHKGKIFIVTPGMIPNWLSNSSNIILINQNDIIPQNLIPTFNTNVIEFFLHKIPGLTEYFIHMNDDFFFCKSINPDDFFTIGKNDIKINFFMNNNIIPHGHDQVGKINKIWLSSVYNTKGFLDLKYGEKKRNFLDHAPYIYHKKIFEIVHTDFYEQISTLNKFRHKLDIVPPFILINATIQKNIVPYEIKYNQSKLITLKNKDSIQLINNIINDKYFMVCINDEHNNDEISKEMQLSLENIFSIPSDHEINYDVSSQLKNLWNEFDREGKNYLTRDEFSRALVNMGIDIEYDEPYFKNEDTDFNNQEKDKKVSHFENFNFFKKLKFKKKNLTNHLNKIKMKVTKFNIIKL